MLYESCDYVVSDDVDITHLVIALRRRLISWKTYARDILISKFSISKSKRGLHQYFNAPCHWQICLRRITSTASSKVLNAYLPLHAHLSPSRKPGHPSPSRPNQNIRPRYSHFQILNFQVKERASSVFQCTMPLANMSA